MSFEILKKHKSFSGETLFCQHKSKSTKTDMKFSVFLPKEIGKIENAIIWLSGLTCNEENFITKAGAQKILANSDTMIICPDTSPRGLAIKGEDDSYDFGTGAGFYINATADAYSENYNMYDYIVKDITSLLKEDFQVKKISILGHSMGGHGALVIGLREKNLFSCISAFSPIVNPTQCPWGNKAFQGYLKEDKQSWDQYDACKLIENGHSHSSKILIDQGLDDEFLKGELLTDNFQKACDQSQQEVQIDYQEGFDHSYYFIASFIEKHISYHLSCF